MTERTKQVLRASLQYLIANLGDAGDCFAGLDGDGEPDSENLGWDLDTANIPQVTEDDIRAARAEIDKI